METDPPPEARVIPLGEPIEGGEAIFAGSLAHARQFIAALSPAERAAISIWTPGHIWTVAELEAQPPGSEHD